MGTQEHWLNGCSDTHDAHNADLESKRDLKWIVVVEVWSQYWYSLHMCVYSSLPYQGYEDDNIDHWHRGGHCNAERASVHCRTTARPPTVCVAVDVPVFACNNEPHVFTPKSQSVCAQRYCHEINNCARNGAERNIRTCYRFVWRAPSVRCWLSQYSMLKAWARDLFSLCSTGRRGVVARFAGWCCDDCRCRRSWSPATIWIWMWTVQRGVT